MKLTIQQQSSLVKGRQRTRSAAEYSEWGWVVTAAETKGSYFKINGK